MRNSSGEICAARNLRIRRKAAEAKRCGARKPVISGSISALTNSVQSSENSRAPIASKICAARTSPISSTSRLGARARTTSSATSSNGAQRIAADGSDPKSARKRATPRGLGAVSQTEPSRAARTARSRRTVDFPLPAGPRMTSDASTGCSSARVWSASSAGTVVTLRNVLRGAAAGCGRLCGTRKTYRRRGRR